MEYCNIRSVQGALATKLMNNLAIPVKTPEEAKAAVDTLSNHGVDFIKVYSMLTRDAFLAVINEAKKMKLNVVFQNYILYDIHLRARPRVDAVYSITRLRLRLLIINLFF